MIRKLSSLTLLRLGLGARVGVLASPPDLTWLETVGQLLVRILFPFGMTGCLLIRVLSIMEPNLALGGAILGERLGEILLRHRHGDILLNIMMARLRLQLLRARDPSPKRLALQVADSAMSGGLRLQLLRARGTSLTRPCRLGA